MRIGYQGVAGSYSEATLQDYIKTLTDTTTEIVPVPYGDFKSVVNDLLDDKLDLIVVPVENSTTGIIARVTDLLRYKPVMAIAEAYQPVRHTLWGVEGSRLEDIQMVYSHPEALSQCQVFFNSYPLIESKVYEDTAKAASYIQSLNRRDIAAIASPRAGELHHLVPLMENVQDESTNTTRFYVIEKIQEREYTGTCLSLYVETRHESGALSKLLQVFDIFNCNLQNLSARPIENQPFTYGFFIEVSIKEMSSPVNILIQTLDQVSEYLQIMGQYDQVSKSIYLDV